MCKVSWNWSRQAFLSPVGYLEFVGEGTGGRELENNGIVCVAQEASAATTAWRLLAVICFMLSGSGIRDEVSCVLIPLQGSHALISLQSQLHQWGLHNPWYAAAATTHSWFAPQQSWWDFKQLAYNNGPEAILVLDRHRGSICCAGADGVGFLGQFSCNAQITYLSLPQQHDYKDWLCLVLINSRQTIVSAWREQS